MRRLQGQRQDGQAHRAEEPAYPEALHPLRELRRNAARGYPLPQYGALAATGEVCEHCGAPLVVVTTAARSVEALPQLRLPRQGTGRGQGRQGREGCRAETGRQEARGEKGPREEAGLQEGPRKEARGEESLASPLMRFAFDGAALRLRRFFMCAACHDVPFRWRCAASGCRWKRGALQCGSQNLTSKENYHMPKVTIVGAGNVGATAAHIIRVQEPG